MCEEGIGNYKFASRCGEWGLYHIYQQLFELLSCILLDDELHVSCHIGEKMLFFVSYSSFQFRALLSN